MQVIIFTDGSSLGNPGPGGFGGVIILPFEQVIELGGSKTKTTNNRMELTAIISALEYYLDHFNNEPKEISVYSDSRYVINGITKWSRAWQANGWQTKNKTDVLNKDLWQELLPLVGEINGTLGWHYVPGHAGVPGNERVDEIAQGFAQGKDVPLYNGPFSEYEIQDILRTPSPEDITAKKSGKAYSYLSMVNGSIERHATWEECKNRVSGKPKAKFRKALSEADERAIIAQWKKDNK